MDSSPENELVVVLDHDADLAALPVDSPLPMAAQDYQGGHGIEPATRTPFRDGQVDGTPQRLLTPDAVAAAAVEALEAEGEPYEPEDDGVEVTLTDAAVLDAVATAYERTLVRAEHARQHLVGIGIGDPALIARFRLGYADKKLFTELPARGPQIRQQLTRLGVLRSTGHQDLLGCITTPIIDGGAVVGLIGSRPRPLTRLQQGLAVEPHTANPLHGVWNADACTGPTIILAPFVRDALVCIAAGYAAATVAPDPDLHPDLRRLLTDRQVREVILTHGANPESDAAVQRIAAACAGLGIGVRRISFPKGPTLGHYAARNLPARFALEPLLAAARPVTPPPVVVVPVAEQAAVPVEQVVVPPASTPAVEVVPTPASSATATAARVTMQGDDVQVVIGPRSYEVRGLGRNRTREVLRVTVRVHDDAGHLHLDALDLYNARQRAAFVNSTAEELSATPELVKHDLGVLLRELERMQEQRLAALAVAGGNGSSEPTPPTISPADEAEALAFLRSPNLIGSIIADAATCGIVGEDNNVVVGYLAMVSRKLDEPLAIIIQALSASGKSTLMEAVTAFVPEEERVSYSALTSKSLYYMGDGNLKHKVLAVAEVQGASQASYALKILQSEGALTIATTRTDPASGRLQTQEYRVEGPVALIATTTAVEIDEELANRAITLSVNEDRDQTKRIHDAQRRQQTLAGLADRRERDRILNRHRNAQRLIKPLYVNNPWAERLRFRDDRTRTRRDHRKYLTLIRTVALLHQHQRPIRSYEHHGERLPYIDVTLADIAIANALAHSVLGRSLDELPPHSRRLLGLLDGMVTAASEKAGVPRSAYRFTRREVRAATGWTNNQVRDHLGKLVEMEYILVHRGIQGQSYVYELLYSGEGTDGTTFCLGLIDVATLAAETGQKMGPNPPESRL
jgi:DNA primase